MKNPKTEITRPCGCVARTEPGFNQTPVIVEFQPGEKCFKNSIPGIREVRIHFGLETIR